MDRQKPAGHPGLKPPPLAPRVVIELLRVVFVALCFIGCVVGFAALRAADSHDPRPILDTGLDATLALTFLGVITAPVIALYAATYTDKLDLDTPDDAQRARMFSWAAEALAILAVVLGVVPVANGAPQHLNVWLLIGGPTVGIIVAALALDTSLEISRRGGLKPVA